MQNIFSKECPIDYEVLCVLKSNKLLCFFFYFFLNLEKGEFINIVLYVANHFVLIACLMYCIIYLMVNEP